MVLCSLSIPSIEYTIICELILENRPYCLNQAWAYHTFQIAYYAVQQCFRFFSILLQLCFIRPYYAPYIISLWFCCLSLKINLFLLEIKLQDHLQFVDHLTILLEYIDLFQWSFEKSYLLVLCSQKMQAKFLHPCIVFRIIPAKKPQSLHISPALIIR